MVFGYNALHGLLHMYMHRQVMPAVMGNFLRPRFMNCLCRLY